ncbi:unnamed protein product [Dracunculus medinensis]|uniref:Arrestin_C domain-containing protein n=1 Tax=Dracunculus medinensis TaxID=318479 RepID=A0A0N4UQ13_DRAME|nr:unnamed protein product [Dracunculus medinensis]
MVKLDKFAIEFSNIEGAYFAGQEVSGKVIIENKEPKKVSEILLELKGRARTYWTKHSGQSRKHCSSAEPYFCEQFNTCYTHKFSRASLDIKEGRILPEGYHEIPFSYILPKNLPTSFEGEFGFIRYTCKATCERPWDFDIVCKKAFSVLQPAKISECNSFARFCCRNQGSILAEMHLERTGFTPGESFCLNIAVRNDSYKTLKACIKFVQTVNYKAKTFAGGEYVRSVDKVVIKKDISEINARKSFNWNERTIVIPSVPPALGTCKIISIYYSLQLQVKFSIFIYYN